MTPELQQSIFLRFPESWFDRTHPGRSLMVFGFEISDGWYPLLWSLFERLEFELNGKNQFEILQVKEKWGDLTIYWSGFSRGENAEKLDDKTFARIAHWIDHAEEVSSSICENCGRLGKRRGGSWVKTLCDVCEEGRTKNALL
jgi:hypothetical protein